MNTTFIPKAAPGLLRMTARGVAVLSLALSLAQAQVVINEIHPSPDARTEPVEFVELFNAGTNAVDLSGWTLATGQQFTFPAVEIAPGGYAVVAQDPAALAAKFGVIAVGPFNTNRTSQLSREGETITLRDAQGRKVDEVTYGSGFPWPTVGDPPGLSIELIHPSLDNDLAGHWRASAAYGAAQPSDLVLIPTNSVWHYFKGTREASSPVDAWRLIGFDDSAWLSAAAPIGYGPAGEPVWTRLDDMRGGYTTVYFRNTFVIDDPAGVSNLALDAVYDDGFKVWINGSNVLNVNIAAGDVPFNGTALSARENNTFEQFAVNNASRVLVAGANTIAIQANNIDINNSSDFFLDVRLRALLGTSGLGPTPGRRNAAFATNSPPAIRQVEHSPEQPPSAQPVTITAKVTDPAGVSAVILEYQVVNPGAYIELTDAAYTNAASWVTVPMNDVGLSGDAIGGDAVYTAVVPSPVQTHRRLVRYRITAMDALGASVRVPYADDPQPNFAYFVYDGVPGWRGAVRPGVTAALDFPATVMARLPVYHLIAKNSSITSATWTSRYGGDAYPWAGTLVYDGKVYDHIHFRARGGVWRYSMCKNMWKFDFNRGHDFQARDNWSRKFTTSWTKLNLGSVIQQGDYNHRGEQGMFESVGFRLFQLMGVPAPNTTFVTFRVIDDAAEADPTTQYEGDFWGLYLSIEQEDGRFLDEHGLADGNYYKMEGGTGELNNLAPVGPVDKSDLNAFLSGQATGSENWWRSNLNLPAYYGYQAVIQAIHHYDIADGKNYFYHRDPGNGKWTVIPWDLDLTWADNMYRSGSSGGDEPFKSRVLSNFGFPGTKAALSTEFRNRVREFRELLWNTDEAYRLIEEHAAMLRGPTSGPGILDADRAMWDYNPKMASSTYSDSPGSKAGQGRYYQWPNEPGVTKDFNGCLQLMKNYVAYRGSAATLAPGVQGLDGIARDPSVPERPVIAYVGPAGYPVNRLSFHVSSFASPNPTNRFGALQWRVAEITSTNAPAYDPLQPGAYEILSSWQSTNTVAALDVTVPPSAVKPGHRYRVRALMMDDAGRGSRWSAPEEFNVGEPDNFSALTNFLRITEVMYHPAPGGFEYVELHNTSDTLALDLTGVKFTQGIEFTFAGGTTIPAGGFLVLSKAADAASFRAYHGLDASVPIVGPFGGSLSDGGEQVVLRTAAGGTDIVAFTYGTGRGWPPTADGAGHSLILLDRALDAQGGGAGNDPVNWRSSTFMKGSPGGPDPTPADPIVLNEIVAHTDFLTEYDSNDWIELYNRSSTSFTLGAGWYLSDDVTNLTKWMIPAGTVIPARGFVVFDEVTGFHNPTNTGFGLNKSGEQVFLARLPGDGSDRIVDWAVFKGQENDWSLGRFPDGDGAWLALSPRSRGASNVPPAAGVHISEVMYHPPDAGTNDVPQLEFVEVHNPTGASVALFNTNGPWRLNGGVTLDFPADLVMPPGGVVLAVNFAPTNLPLRDAFLSAYPSVTDGVLIVGPYGGKLANSVDRIALEKPQAPDVPGEPISWVIVDEVFYGDRVPWPARADGGGASLHRVRLEGSGVDPGNWAAMAPSPGVATTPDGDGDGLPDAWEVAHGLDPENPADALWDGDDDGQDNISEYGAGTDPKDPVSCLRLEWVRLNPAGLTLRFTALPGRTYTVQGAEVLDQGAWIRIKDLPAQSGERLEEIELGSAEAGSRYFRVVTPATP